MNSSLLAASPLSGIPVFPAFRPHHGPSHRLTDDPVEYVPFAFAAAITVLTILNVPLLLLGANIWSVVGAWTCGSSLRASIPIRYILSTPRYRATIDVLMERLKNERQVQWRRVYDESGYTIYELGQATGSASQ